MCLRLACNIKHKFYSKSPKNRFYHSEKKARSALFGAPITSLNIGTIEALIQLLDDFTQHLDNPSVKYIQSAALDFPKAFDRLQPPTLIKKMRYYDFNPAIVSLVSSFLENRKQCVKYGNCKSSYKDNKIGAPQGTKLGPILWLIYSNDLKAEGFQHIKYADDTTFYAAVKSQSNQPAITPAIAATFTW